MKKVFLSAAFSLVVSGAAFAGESSSLRSGALSALERSAAMTVAAPALPEPVHAKAAAGVVFDCTVTEVTNAASGAGLGNNSRVYMTEDAFDGKTVWFGDVSYSEGKNDSITLEPSVGFNLGVTISPKNNSGTSYSIALTRTFPGGSDGKIVARNSSGTVDIATLSCK